MDRDRHLRGIDQPDPDIEGAHERGRPPRVDHDDRHDPQCRSDNTDIPSCVDTPREPSSTSLSDQTAISTSSSTPTTATPAYTSATTAWTPYSTQDKSKDDTPPTLYSPENAAPILYSTENTSPILYSAETKTDLHAHDDHWENPLHRPPHAVLAKESDGEVVTIPDGGWRAWLVVLGAGHVTFATFGFVVSLCVGVLGGYSGGWDGMLFQFSNLCFFGCWVWACIVA